MSKADLIFYKGNWYHPNFFGRRKTCLKKAHYICAHCGRKQGDTYITQRGCESKVVLQAHHPNNDRTNPSAALIALCKSCHMAVDGRNHRNTRVRKAREAEIQAGQMILPGFRMHKGRKATQWRNLMKPDDIGKPFSAHLEEHASV